MFRETIKKLAVNNGVTQKAIYDDLEKRVLKKEITFNWKKLKGVKKVSSASWSKMGKSIEEVLSGKKRIPLDVLCEKSGVNKIHMFSCLKWFYREGRLKKVGKTGKSFILIYEEEVIITIKDDIDWIRIVEKLEEIRR